MHRDDSYHYFLSAYSIPSTKYVFSDLIPIASLKDEFIILLEMRKLRLITCSRSH